MLVSSSSSSSSTSYESHLSTSSEDEQESDYEDDIRHTTKSSSSSSSSTSKGCNVDSDIVTTTIPTEKILEMTATQMTAIPSTILHEHLKKVDPNSANRLHPNNQRKIIR